MSVPLHQLVAVNPRFRRSVNLEADVDLEGTLEGYVVSPLAKEVLFRVLRSLAPDSRNRAWALVGPYGSGKSSFAAFLSLLLEPRDDGLASTPQALFARQWPDHAEELNGLRDRLGAPIVPIPVTGQRAPLTRTLLRAMHRASLRFWSGPGSKPNVLYLLEEALEASRAGEPVEGLEVVDLATELARKIASSSRNCAGICFILDEFGKNLEWMAQHPREGDIYLLQQLAEASARASDARMGLLTIVHQSFDAYAEGLPRAMKEEWIKVEGRFELVPYLESPGHLLGLVNSALQVDAAAKHHPIYQRVREAGRRLHGLTPSQESDQTSSQTFDTCFPLNPVTALCLGPVFRLQLGQNERSLFAFLASEEPEGLRDFLLSVDEEESTSYTLDRLYDYLITNTGVRYASDSRERTWAATEQALSRLPASAGELEVRVLKALALLSLVGIQVGLRPDAQTIAIAIDREHDAVESSLRALESASAIVYREYKRAYQIWDGSDLDVAALLRRWRRDLEAQGGYARRLQQLFPPHPIVATKHYLKTGTLRFLVAHYVSPDGLSKAPSRGNEGDGDVLYVIPDSMADLNSIDRLAHTASTRDAGRPLLAVTPSNGDVLLTCILDFFAVVEALKGTPELSHDPVARRELEERRLAAQDRLRSALTDAYGQGRAGGDAKWYFDGQPVSVGQRPAGLASQIFDQIYDLSPRIVNELINRETLSSAAAAAQRQLMERMITDADKEQLGITGHPAELSLYLSVLRETKLHVPEAGSQWKLTTPGKQSRLHPCWEQVTSELRGARDHRLDLATLFGRLSNPPFGVRRGIAPILVLAYYLGHARELFLYEDNSFVPEMEADLIQRMLRRPDSIELQWVGLGATTNELVEVIAAELLPQHPQVGLLDLVRAIVRLVNSLSSHAATTQRISDEARRVRAAIKAARDPVRLLLVALPEAVGLPCMTTPDEQTREAAEQLSARLRSTLRELQRVDRSLLAHVDLTLRRLLSCETDDQAFYGSLKTRATNVRASIELEPTLERFVTITAEMDPTSEAGQHNWLEGVATGILGKQPRHWDDTDISKFERSCMEACRGFRAAEELALELGSLPSPSDNRIFRVSVLGTDGRERSTVTTLDAADEDSLHVFLSQLDDLAQEHGLSTSNMAYAVIARMLEQADSHARTPAGRGKG